MVREIRQSELNELLELYTHLHESGVPENSDHLNKTWKTICNDNNHHIIVCRFVGKFVSLCFELRARKHYGVTPCESCNFQMQCAIRELFEETETKSDTLTEYCKIVVDEYS